jgi:drug/metabolite transporter, DME family
MGKVLPVFMIVAAATLWGIIALFVKELAEIGFLPMEIVAIRASIAFLFLLFIGVMFYRKQLKVVRKDVPIFMGSGILSIVFFNWCYFTTINEMNLSLAVILLYTAPAIVVLLSRFVFKEKLTKQKLLAVLATLIGCVLITGVGINSTDNLSMIGILTGLGSGIGYALYSIFGKIALRRNHSFTITFYTFFFASLFLIPVTALWEKLDLLLQMETLLWAIGLGLFPTVLAYLLYTKGLAYIESGQAAIIATVEPIIATLLGVILYKEGMGWLQMLGTGLIFCSVILVNRTGRKNSHLNTSKAREV